jgi:hypothetical protein
MNLRSEVHSAVTTQFSTKKIPVEKFQTKSHVEGPEYFRPLLLDRWDPYCDYVRMHPKQFTVARLLMRYGASSPRVKIENFNLRTPVLNDNFLISEMWSVLVIDCATSIVLAWVVGMQTSRFKSFPLEQRRIDEEPRFLFNHFDDNGSRVMQIIKEISHYQLEKLGFHHHQPPFLAHINRALQNVPRGFCRQRRRIAGN